MLDIEKLKLTAEELDRCFDCNPLTSQPDRNIRDAQLAKALWGLAEWLDEMGGETCVQGAVDLLNILEAAGIPCPEGIDVSGKWL